VNQTGSFVKEVFSEQCFDLSSTFPAHKYFMMTLEHLVARKETQKSSSTRLSEKQEMDIRGRIMRMRPNVVKHYFALNDQGKHVFMITQRIMFISYSCSRLISLNELKNARDVACTVLSA
jgi:hypothetical protein